MNFFPSYHFVHEGLRLGATIAAAEKDINASDRDRERYMAKEVRKALEKNNNNTVILLTGMNHAKPISEMLSDVKPLVVNTGNISEKTLNTLNTTGEFKQSVAQIEWLRNPKNAFQLGLPGRKVHETDPHAIVNMINTAKQTTVGTSLEPK